MKRSSFLWILILLFSLGIITQAQDNNLLDNPGFEDSFSGSAPVEVANGWTNWHVQRTDDQPSFQNTQPTYEPAAPDQSRIRTGDNAQLYFSFFETHEGGIYQQVDGIGENTEVRFSIYAYVWSSTFEDVDVSEDPGDVALRVGIDPNGGTDPSSDDIEWSTPAVFYDAYRQYSVIATSASDTVTVWVRSTVGNPVQNSYVYLDDAVLELTSPPVAETEEPTEEPTDEPTEEPTDEPTEEPTEEPTDDGIGEATPTQESLPETEEPTDEPTDEPVVPTATPVPTESPPITDTFPGTIIHTVQRGKRFHGLHSCTAARLTRLSKQTA